MDYEALGEHAAIATRFLDNVVNANYYFYEENKKAQFKIRRTGLGTLGLADALIKMGIKYGSVESIPVIEKIYQTIRDNAYETSSLLAKEKGSFGGFIKEKYLQGAFIKKLPQKPEQFHFLPEFPPVLSRCMSLLIVGTTEPENILSITLFIKNGLRLILTK